MTGRDRQREGRRQRPPEGPQERQLDLQLKTRLDGQLAQAASADSPVAAVADRIAHSARTVYLTGAGLSVASGIAPYRTSADAVWSRFITTWGTFERLAADPGRWWKEFWIQAHGPLSGPESLADKHPNAGHDALTQLVERDPGDLIVTQNIDGLHRRAGVPEEKLIEIHGRHDRFVCTGLGCAHVLDAFERVDLSTLDRGTYPRCPACQSPLRPCVLLFDELYDSHPLYQARRAREALADADVIVFVGTSFSVGITDFALRAGAHRGAVLVNVNVEEAAVSGLGASFVNLLGPAEETLPKLAALVCTPRAL